MIIEKVILEGFGSYKDYTLIEFQKGITAIIASYDENSKRSNGGGKSQIIMSILYALYGEGDFNTLAELINDKCDTMSVELFFNLNGNNYKISRGILKKSSFLDFYQNDNRLGKSIDEAQKEIENVFNPFYLVILTNNYWWFYLLNFLIEMTNINVFDMYCKLTVTFNIMK